MEPLLPLEPAGEVLGSAFAREEGCGSRSRVYWFLPTRPRFVGGRPVFLWEGLGRGGVRVARVEASASGLRVFEGAGSGEGSESGWMLNQEVDIRTYKD